MKNSATSEEGFDPFDASSTPEVKDVVGFAYERSLKSGRRPLFSCPFMAHYDSPEISASRVEQPLNCTSCGGSLVGRLPQNELGGSDHEPPSSRWEGSTVDITERHTRKCGWPQLARGGWWYSWSLPIEVKGVS